MGYKYLVVFLIAWLRISESVLTGQLELAVQLSRLKCIECEFPTKYRVAVTVSTRCKDKLIPAVPYHYDQGDNTKNLNYFAGEFEYEHIWKDRNTYMTEVHTLDLYGKSADIDRVVYFRIDLPALPSYMEELALFIEFKLLPIGEIFGRIPLPKEVGYNNTYINAVVVRLTNVAKGVSEYTQVIFDKWKMQIQLDAVVHAYFIGFDSKVLKYGTVVKGEDYGYWFTDYNYWDGILGSWRHKEVKNWFRGYNFGGSNGANGMPSLFSASMPDFVSNLLEDVLRKEDENVTLSKSSIETAAGLRFAYFIYAKILANNYRKISKMIAENRIDVDTNVSRQKLAKRDDVQTPKSEPPSQPSPIPTIKDAILDITDVDLRVVTMSESFIDGILVKKTFTPNDGFRITEIYDMNLPVWTSGGQNEHAKSVVIHYDGDSPVSLTVTHATADKDSVMKYYSKDGTWTQVNKTDFGTVIANIKRLAVLLKLTPIKLNVGGIDASLFTVEEFTDREVPIKHIAPEKTYRLTEVSEDTLPIWKGENERELCQRLWLYYDGDKPTLAVLNCLLRDGRKYKTYRYKDGTGQWHATEGDDYRSRLVRLKEKVSQSTPVSLDITSPDPSNIDIHEGVENGISYKHYSVNDGHYVSSVVEGTVEIWKAGTGDEMYTFVEYYSKECITILGLSVNYSHFTRPKCFEKNGQEWNAISDDEFFDRYDLMVEEYPDVATKVDGNLFATELGNDGGVPTLKLTAKTGATANKLTFDDKDVWQGRLGESCSEATFYLGPDNEPTAATFRFKNSTGRIVECYRKFDGMTWSHTRKDDFDNLLRALENESDRMSSMENGQDEETTMDNHNTVDGKGNVTSDAEPSTSTADQSETTCPSTDAPLSTLHRVSPLGEPGLIEVTDRTSLVSSEKGSKVTFSNGLDHTLSKALEDLAEKLGIESLPGNYISIPMGDNIRLKARDITVDGDDKNVVNKTLGVLQANLKDLQTSLESLWKDFLETQRTTKAFDLYGKDYWYKKGLFFKKLFSQPDSDAVLSLIKSLNITDEHDFFIADTFPYIKRSPKFLKIDPSSEYVEKDYSDHLVILVHGYGPNTITVRGFRNNILTMFRGSRCEVCISTGKDFNKPIGELAERLANEIKDRIACSAYKDVKRISFVTHSLGGILVRKALDYMDGESIKKLYAFITIATPHIGYPLNPTIEVDPCCIALYAWWNSAQCIKQTLMRDKICCGDNKNSFLYKLSKNAGISNFKKIVLIGVKNDKKTYAYSALINASEMRTCSRRGKEMEANIMSHIGHADLTRILITYGRAKKYLHEVPTTKRRFHGRNYYAHSNVLDERIVNRILLSMLHDTF